MPASACGSGEGRRRSRRRSGCSPRPGHRAATSSRPARWRRSAASARSGWATPSASRRRVPRRPALPAPGARGGRLRRPAGASRARSGPPSTSSPSRTRSSTSARTTIDTRSRSRSTARSRRRSSRPRSSATTASPRTSARRRRCASSARPASARPRRSSTPRRKSNITGRSSPLSTNPFMATLALRIEPAPAGSGIEVRTDVEIKLVPLYLFHTVETFQQQLEAYVREALTEGLAGWQVTDCRVTITDCGYRIAGDERRRLPASHPTRRGDGVGAGRDVGLRAASRPLPGAAELDRAGRARRPGPARWARDRPVLRERPVARVRRASGRARPRPAEPAAGAVDGGGDPRDALRGLPADRRAPADATALEPEPARPRRLARVAREAG